jgi:Flp pilus assembly protein TadG
MRSSARSERGTCGDRGQATVELALCLPLVCLLLLAVVQVAIVVRDQLVVQLAAREAARAAAVSGDAGGAGRHAGEAAGGLSGMAVDIAESGEVVTAAVTYLARTDVPLVGLLVPDLTLRASVSMRIEPP